MQQLKLQTMSLLQKHLADERFEFVLGDGTIEFKYDFSDDEIQELVESEYNKDSITQPVSELFEIIVKKVIAAGVEHAKANSDKLSDL